MKKRIHSIVLTITLFLFFICKSVVVAESDSVDEVTIQENDLYAQAAVLMDAQSGRVLYAKNGAMVLPMASTTKIMTCIIALEQGVLEDVAVVSSNAARMPDVQLNAKEGEKFILKDLLYSLMLESHNDSAVIIAEHVGGSVEGFASKMNQKAKEIGCDSTYYITPNGLDGEDEHGIHATTASDLARVMAYCINESPMKDVFLEITRTQSYSFSNIITNEDGTTENGSRSFSCNNHNAFLSMMEGALSGKTGFTSKAGFCYVGALKSGERTFTVALLACGWPNNKSYKWSDTKKLMNYGISNFEYLFFDEIKIEEKDLKPLLVLNGKTKGIGEKVTVPLSIVKHSKKEENNQILLKKGEKVDVILHREEWVDAPAKKGDVIGFIQYQVGDLIWREEQIVVSENIEEIDFAWYLQKVFEIYIL